MVKSFYQTKQRMAKKMEQTWKIQHTVSGREFYVNGHKEIWIEDGKFLLYAYVGYLSNNQPELIKTFDTFQEAKNYDIFKVG